MIQFIKVVANIYLNRRENAMNAKAMYDSQEIVDYFLSKSPMSNKKLQKLLYYAYAWVIAICNDDEDCIEYRLFPEHPQAWVHGPAFHNIYSRYKRYGWDDIPQVAVTSNNLNREVTSILDKVWSVYSKYSANDLESITHQEDPWLIARGALSPFESCSKELDDREIFRYYNKIYQDDDRKRKNNGETSDIFVS